MTNSLKTVSSVTGVPGNSFDAADVVANELLPRLAAERLEQPGRGPLPL